MKKTAQLSIVVALLVVVGWTGSQLVSGALTSRVRCQTSADCGENQCCAETPNGLNVCLDYEPAGERCFFHFRTPTCGCAKGLKCVSTMPMESGDWNHDYVCARVRPFQHFKLLPYFDDLPLLQNDLHHFFRR